MSQSQDRYEWNGIDWRKLERKTFKLQKRIYQASQCNDHKKMHNLQRLLIKSTSGKLLAVKRVSQDNAGKKTAGIDGVKSLGCKQRLNLSMELDLTRKSSPVRRVLIPKSGKTEKRPLGIPTMSDRSKQALVKMALEPEWEAKFEPNSYGFRPGRSCHDACDAIFEAIKRKTAYVLDADISGCFDNINHKMLLDKLNTFPRLRRVIKGWLRSGIIYGQTFQNTQKGTPQGGVISPLLANIALHGLEYETKEAIKQELFKYKKFKNSKASYMHAQKMMSVIRYADDFIVLHESKELVEKAKTFIETWLKKIGLELNNKKTRMAHTLGTGDINPGFNFLGYTIRQFRTNQRKKGYITLLKPSRESQKRHAMTIGEKIKKMRGLSQEAVISTLNPIIRGWSQYYVPGVSRKIFERLDNDMHCKFWKWALYKHPNKGQRWSKRKYFRLHENDKWRFKTHNCELLLRHTDFHIKRHIKVAGNKSPYDGNWVYWAMRLGRSPAISSQMARLIKAQNGKCIKCGNWSSTENLLEIKCNDKSTKNKVVLHKECCNARYE